MIYFAAARQFKIVSGTDQDADTTITVSFR
jgi:hypothetical protein